MINGLITGLILIGLWSSSVCEFNETADCEGETFRCFDGSACLPPSFFCDGRSHCADDSDEYSCKNETCKESQFRCFDGTCAPQHWRCDGVPDCKDGSDEFRCTEAEMCGNGYWKCSSGKCIQIGWRCDQEPDCEDGSDEIGCHVACKKDHFQCTSGVCIPQSWRCDSHPDCRDASDERGCNNTQLELPEVGSNSETENETPDLIEILINETKDGCKADHFLCDEKRCVPVQWRCDGEEDCRDKSDETDCPTEMEPTTLEIASPTDSTVIAQTNLPASHVDPAERTLIMSGSELPCQVDHFRCDIDRCVPNAWICDGAKDCIDQSDELNCTRMEGSCKPDEFRCTGAAAYCIPMVWRCDGEYDCFDQTDEQDCIQGPSSSMEEGKIPVSEANDTETVLNKIAAKVTDDTIPSTNGETSRYPGDTTTMAKEVTYNGNQISSDTATETSSTVAETIVQGIYNYESSSSQTEPYTNYQEPTAADDSLPTFTSTVALGPIENVTSNYDITVSNNESTTDKYETILSTIESSTMNDLVITDSFRTTFQNDTSASVDTLTTNSFEIPSTTQSSRTNDTLAGNYETVIAYLGASATSSNETPVVRLETTSAGYESSILDKTEVTGFDDMSASYSTTTINKTPIPPLETLNYDNSMIKNSLLNDSAEMSSSNYETSTFQYPPTPGDFQPTSTDYDSSTIENEPTVMTMKEIYISDPATKYENMTNYTTSPTTSTPFTADTTMSTIFDLGSMHVNDTDQITNFTTTVGSLSEIIYGSNTTPLFEVIYVANQSFYINTTPDAINDQQNLSLVNNNTSDKSIPFEFPIDNENESISEVNQSLAQPFSVDTPLDLVGQAGEIKSTNHQLYQNNSSINPNTTFIESKSDLSTNVNISFNEEAAADSNITQSDLDQNSYPNYSNVLPEIILDPITPMPLNYTSFNTNNEIITEYSHFPAASVINDSFLDPGLFNDSIISGISESFTVSGNETAVDLSVDLANSTVIEVNNSSNSTQKNTSNTKASSFLSAKIAKIPTTFNLHDSIANILQLLT